MKENLKTGTKSTENLSSPIIYIKMSHIFFKQLLKNENKYWEKTEQITELYRASPNKK